MPDAALTQHTANLCIWPATPPTEAGRIILVEDFYQAGVSVLLRQHPLHTFGKQSHFLQQRSVDMCLILDQCIAVKTQEQTHNANYFHLVDFSLVAD
ncbi:MAG: hypothetical protein GFH27_549347n15 [Chloroflexi bacterium AL-W]|nr:hypothetical protein [Chloroflexi bacterium AL-N1]NOK70797.1 hypothetical protein [Chloroflexi bacterium AL-N10]NOK78357.1 hypothetical protein [Chloroflexi bacterium AL-N5]NOK85338.1 hypothetical protein [Chloroflexi bacterium AL-W]NOK92614.1 hypothetical protein [Chloroflexi bacterium AL-N15]